MRIEAPVPDAALAAIRAPWAGASAERVDAPILQPLNLLLELAGEAMRARLFVVQAEGGAEACLRPDFTVAVARRHIERGSASARYFYEGQAFRASNDDRPEEFLQLGLELFAPPGGSRAEADAEIARLAWQSAAAGGRDDLMLWLGDVGLFAAFIESLEMPEILAARLARMAGRPRLLAAELARAGDASPPATGGLLAELLAGLDAANGAGLLEEVWALAGIEPVGGRGPAEIARRLVRKAEAAATPALSPSQADAIRQFMAISDTPAKGLDLTRLAQALQFDALSIESVVEVLEALDWVGQLGDDSGRYVLLADPQRTRLAPLMEQLLITRSGSPAGFWHSAHWPDTLLVDALAQTAPASAG